MTFIYAIWPNAYTVNFDFQGHFTAKIWHLISIFTPFLLRACAVVAIVALQTDSLLIVVAELERDQIEGHKRVPDILQHTLEQKNGKRRHTFLR